MFRSLFAAIGLMLELVNLGSTMLVIGVVFFYQHYAMLVLHLFLFGLPILVLWVLMGVVLALSTANLTSLVLIDIIAVLGLALSIKFSR